MVVFKLIEIIVLVLLLWGIVSQILIPVMEERPTFPFFRKTEGAIVDELVAVNQTLHEQELKEEVEHKKSLIKPDVKTEVSADTKDQTKKGE